MPGGEIDYLQLLQQALRSVAHQALAQVAAEGRPAGHHFYLTFDTCHEGVELPRLLRDRYPREMTVVLQHQFWDLEVDEDAFSVTLRFDGLPHRLTVPFAALVQFVDPEAEFSLRFAPPAEAGDEVEATEGAPPAAVEEGVAGGEPTEPPSSARVVSLDDFRKK